MKKLLETTNQIVDDGDLSNPELIVVDIQVRSGGRIDPPPWFRRAKNTVEGERHLQKKKSNT